MIKCNKAYVAFIRWKKMIKAYLCRYVGKRTVAFHTLGCKLNFAETSSLSRMMESDGFEKRILKSWLMYMSSTPAR
jgi:hypothetical protein